MKVNILTGGGRVTFKPLAPDQKRAMQARVAALMGTPVNATVPSTKAGF
jgi:hypothetical protein